MIVFRVEFYVLSQVALDRLRHCVNEENEREKMNEGQTITLLEEDVEGFGHAGFMIPMEIAFNNARGTVSRIGDHLEPVIRVYRALTDPTNLIEGGKAVRAFFVPRVTEEVNPNRKVWIE